MFTLLPVAVSYTSTPSSVTAASFVPSAELKADLAATLHHNQARKDRTVSTVMKLASSLVKHACLQEHKQGAGHDTRTP